MAGDLTSFARRAATLPATLVQATPDAVRAGAAALEDASRRNLRDASGGDLRLSRVRSGRGARVDVRITESGSGSRTRAAVTPVGPVMLVEGDTRRHRQPFQYVAQRTGGARTYSMARRRKAARNGRGLIYVPGVGMFQGVTHPGTQGKEPLRRAFADHHDEAGRLGLAVFADAMRRHLST